jgi:hypothetical protein
MQNFNQFRKTAENNLKWLKEGKTSLNEIRVPGPGDPWYKIIYALGAAAAKKLRKLGGHRPATPNPLSPRDGFGTLGADFWGPLDNLIKLIQERYPNDPYFANFLQQLMALKDRYGTLEIVVRPDGSVVTIMKNSDGRPIYQILKSDGSLTTPLPLGQGGPGGFPANWDPTMPWPGDTGQPGGSPFFQRGGDEFAPINDSIRQWWLENINNIAIGGVGTGIATLGLGDTVYGYGDEYNLPTEEPYMDPFTTPGPWDPYQDEINNPGGYQSGGGY